MRSSSFWYFFCVSGGVYAIVYFDRDIGAEWRHVVVLFSFEFVLGSAVFEPDIGSSVVDWFKVLIHGGI